ncbi:unnamed protein product, partial [Urochloa humidicola]
SSPFPARVSLPRTAPAPPPHFDLPPPSSYAPAGLDPRSPSHALSTNPISFSSSVVCREIELTHHCHSNRAAASRVAEQRWHGAGSPTSGRPLEPWGGATSPSSLAATWRRRSRPPPLPSSALQGPAGGVGAGVGPRVLAGLRGGARGGPALPLRRVPQRTAHVRLRRGQRAPLHAGHHALLLALVWERQVHLESSLEFQTSSMISKISSEQLFPREVERDGLVWC